MWHRLDWNPIDGWGGINRVEWAKLASGTDAHLLVHSWAQGGGSIIHEEPDLIIYLAFFAWENDQYDGHPYFTVMQKRAP